MRELEHDIADRDAELEASIQQLRAFNIRIAALLQSETFDLFVKSAILLSIFLLGIYVAI